MELDWRLLLNWGSQQKHLCRDLKVKRKLFMLILGRVRRGIEAKETALAKVLTCWNKRKRRLWQKKRVRKSMVEDEVRELGRGQMGGWL